jgi:hypothetical protein
VSQTLPPHRAVYFLMRGQYDEAVADARRAVLARPMCRTLPRRTLRGGFRFQPRAQISPRWVSIVLLRLAHRISLSEFPSTITFSPALSPEVVTRSVPTRGPTCTHHAGSKSMSSVVALYL